MTKKELSQKTIAELRALAKKHGVTLVSRLKADLVDAVTKALKKLGPTKTKKAAKTVKKAKSAAKVKKKAATSKAPATKKKSTAKKKTATKKAAAKKTVSKKQPSAKVPSQAKTPVKAPSKAKALELMKKDLVGMTVPLLKEVSRKLGLKQSYATKAEFVDALAKDLKKLRAEAKKKASEAEKQKVGTKKTAKKVVKKAVTRKVAELKPSGKTAPKVPSAKGVRPSVKKAVEESAVPVPARPKVEKARKKLVSAPRRVAKVAELSRPRVPEILPGEERAIPHVELLATIAVEPTVIFVSWVFNPERTPAGPLLLRVQEDEGGFFDVPISGFSGSTSIQVLPGRHYHVIAGSMGASGAFAPLRRSNSVVTPPGAVQPLKQEHLGAKETLPEEFYAFTPQEYGSH